MVAEAEKSVVNKTRPTSSRQNLPGLQGGAPHLSLCRDHDGGPGVEGAMESPRAAEAGH